VKLDDLFAPFNPPGGTLVDRLQFWAAEQPSETSFYYLVDGEKEEVSLTYHELDQRAKAIAAKFAEKGLAGERALLLFPPGLEFVEAFFGCLYAGVTPVPAYPPRRNRNMKRIEAISDDAGARAALTTKSVADRVVDMLDEAPHLREVEWIAVDEIATGEAANWARPAIDTDTLAVLQYTSGSTGTPKGVMLTHANLMHNCSLIVHSFEPNRNGVGMTWLPTYHDMGLVGGVLKPMFYGRPNVLMSPMSFLQKPVRWLQAISNYNVSISGGPNFAYDLCVEKIEPEQCEGLDLSSWDVAFNGAEPIKSATLNAFTEKFAPYGFRAETHYACYGMAETTLIITGSVKQQEPVIRDFHGRLIEEHRVEPVEADDENARQLVGCGRILPDEEVIIVEPASRVPCASGAVGEIWVISPSIGKGYWRKPDETRETFHAKLAAPHDKGKQYLRTGDYGFIDQGELFVTGRVKDLIIVRGVNRYPQDIEATVEKVSDRLRPSGCAAFAVDVAGRERLVVVAEVERSRNKDFGDVVAQIRSAITAEHDLPPDAVILVRPGSIPKTSSGKIQRHACRTDLVEKRLSIVVDWYLWRTDQPHQAAEAPAKLLTVAADDDSGLNPNIVAAVKEQVRVVGRERAKDLQLDTNIVIDLGLDSLERLQIANALEQKFGGRFPDEVLQQIETIREVATAIDKYIGDQPSDANGQAADANSHLHGGKADYCRFDKMPEYTRLKQMKNLLLATGVQNPYFKVHDAPTGATTVIDGQEMINFSTYDYIAMASDPVVMEAAKEAIDKYGTSVSASRLLSGERQVHRELEELLIRWTGREACITFVGGHVCNETTIGHLFGAGDLILHDALAHNSIIKGAELSGARRRPFEHNDWQAVDDILSEVRGNYRRVLIAIEGLYSMDGDFPDLPGFIRVKKKHKAILYMDEAHSLGTMGATGRGLTEHYGCDPKDVDIIMGTMSKGLGGGGGGFIASSKELVEYLKYTAPSFVFSTGLPPSHAAATIAAINLLQREPDRATRVRANACLFIERAQERGLNTGLSDGTPVVPLIIGNSLHALQLSGQLASRGVNVQPILHPAVEEEKSRLRFFITSAHTEEQIIYTVDAAAEELAKIDPGHLCDASGGAA